MMTTLRGCIALTVLLLTMAACGAPGRDPAVPLPSVGGRAAADPVITIPRARPPGRLIVRTVIPGHGPVIRPNDYVLFNVQGRVWPGGREIVDSYASRQPQGLPLRAGLKAWRHLAGQRVGSRVLMVVPPRDGFGRAGDPRLNVTGQDTLVFVFDLLASMGPTARASGTVLPYHPGPGLPRLTGGSGDPAKTVITVPHGARPPAGLVRRLLVRGHGPPVRAGRTVVVQDLGVVWRTGQIFDSSWARGFPESFRLGAGQVIPGWDRGLAGLPAGSRVLLVIPPRLGYGQAGDAPDVGPRDTLVFVIDILAAVS
ncbi:MAG TPA: FKBP-type peptidyl-prolyl cis-trans isomerase [Streptosporangiaceae bacterium]|jgi:peptidylprolyl isomerase|nr:FKBP-type peptidyl-prolyl cis-trans isomerase [Streptosporangiaceae bacterium]